MPDLTLLTALLNLSAERHQHLCPRQVLGVRMGLLGLKELGLLPASGRFSNTDKRLLTIVETDGCGADGVAVATDCAVGRRTLRVLDFGKVATTMIDVESGRAIRIHPHPHSRQRAQQTAPSAPSPWHAYLSAYQTLPDCQLLIAQPVTLTQSLAQILSKPTARAICATCGEEIINEREVKQNGITLCQPCAGTSYYAVTASPQSS